MSESAGTTQKRLLDAAEELFASRGFDQVSIRDLAAAAEVNVAAVNYHFQGKENLFREVILRRFVAQRNDTLQALEETLASKDGRPDLEDVIAALTRRHLTGAIGRGSRLSFLSLMVGEMVGEMSSKRGPARDAFFREMVAPVFAAFTKALTTAHPQLQAEDLTWCIASIVGQIHHFIFRWKTARSLDPEGEAYQTLLRVFPAIDLPADQYIEHVTLHVTRFSSAAIKALHPEVE